MIFHIEMLGCIQPSRCLLKDWQGVLLGIAKKAVAKVYGIEPEEITGRYVDDHEPVIRRNKYPTAVVKIYSTEGVSMQDCLAIDSVREKIRAFLDDQRNTDDAQVRVLVIPCYARSMIVVGDD
ncbi:MAG: hypothetical protein ABIA47_03720 [bacterium]